MFRGSVSRLRQWGARLVQFKKRVGLAFLVVVAVVLGVVLWNPVPWLLKWVLVFETPFQPADLIFVWGTGQGLERAVEFYREGVVQGILITVERPERYRGVEAAISQYDFIKQELNKAGIPSEAIYEVDCPSKRWAYKQYCFRQLMDRHGFDSYIQQTTPLNTRLLYRVHQATFPEGEVTLVLLTDESNVVLRKQIVHIHNTVLSWFYWVLVSKPELQQMIATER